MEYTESSSENSKKCIITSMKSPPVMEDNNMFSKQVASIEYDIKKLESFFFSLCSTNKKYNGILDAYALLAIYNKKKLAIEAQIEQAIAAEKLGKKELSRLHQNSQEKI